MLTKLDWYPDCEHELFYQIYGKVNGQTEKYICGPALEHIFYQIQEKISRQVWAAGSRIRSHLLANSGKDF